MTKSNPYIGGIILSLISIFSLALNAQEETQQQGREDLALTLKLQHNDGPMVSALTAGQLKAGDKVFYKIHYKNLSGKVIKSPSIHRIIPANMRVLPKSIDCQQKCMVRPVVARTIFDDGSGSALMYSESLLGRLRIPAPR